MSEVVYCLLDPRNGDIRYVGKTNNPVGRLAFHHMAPPRGDRTHCANWKRQMAADGVCCEIAILAKGLSHERACKEERWWIAYGLRKAKWPLTNLTDGGEGPNGFVMPESAKASIAASKVGVPRSEETKAKLRVANLGTKHGPTSEEQKAKLRASNLGKKHNNGVNISAAKTGKKCSEQGRANMSLARLGNTNRLGIPHTDEAKAKISAGNRAAWERRKLEWIKSE